MAGQAASASAESASGLAQGEGGPSVSSSFARKRDDVFGVLDLLPNKVEVSNPLFDPSADFDAGEQPIASGAAEGESVSAKVSEM